MSLATSHYLHQTCLQWSQRLCYHLQESFKRKIFTLKNIGGKRVQHLAIAFWHQWRKELLLTLQERQKWHLQKRNFRVGVIVLLKVDAHRNNRPMAKIIPVSPDKDGAVQMSNYLLVHVIGTKTILSRPIHEIVLLVEAEGKKNLFAKIKKALFLRTRILHFY